MDWLTIIDFGLDIVDWFTDTFEIITDAVSTGASDVFGFVEAIPSYIDHVVGYASTLPSFVVPFACVAVSLMVCNKILDVF